MLAWCPSGKHWHAKARSLVLQSLTAVLTVQVRLDIGLDLAKTKANLQYILLGMQAERISTQLRQQLSAALTAAGDALLDGDNANGAAQPEVGDGSE